MSVLYEHVYVMTQLCCNSHVRFNLIEIDVCVAAHDEAQALSIQTLRAFFTGLTPHTQEFYQKNISALLAKVLGDVGITDLPSNNSEKIRRVLSLMSYEHTHGRI